MKWNCHSGRTRSRSVLASSDTKASSSAWPAGRRQARAHEVAAEIEVLVGHPVRAQRVLARAAAEPREGEEAFLERAAEAPEIDAGIEHDDPDDHHQVGRAIHPEPCGIDRGHAFRFAGHRITVKHMAYFVTGATGFIGRYLVERLLARGERVFVLVRPRVHGEVRGAARVLGRARQPRGADRGQPRGAEPRRLQGGPPAAHRQGRPPVPPGGDLRPAGVERGAGPREHRRHRPCAAVRGFGAGRRLPPRQFDRRRGHLPGQLPREHVRGGDRPRPPVLPHQARVGGAGAKPLQAALARVSPRHRRRPFADRADRQDRRALLLLQDDPEAAAVIAAVVSADRARRRLHQPRAGGLRGRGHGPPRAPART